MEVARRLRHCNRLLAMVLNSEVVNMAQKELDWVVGSDRLPTWEDKQNPP